MAAELKIDKELIAVPPRGVRGGVVSLSQMRGSDIAVTDECSAVNIKTLVDCKLVLGPILGPVVAEDCHGCVFTLVAHGLEVRNCTDCIFYTAFCEPSVEESEGIIIGPYNGTHEGNFASLCFKFGLDLKDPGGIAIPYNEDESSGKPSPVQYVHEADPVMDTDGSKLLPKGICILREVFWRFDKDRDGQLSCEEWSALENALMLQPSVHTEATFQDMFQTELGLPLSADGRVPFASFVKYYEHVGRIVLTEHMANANIDVNHLPECRVDDMMSPPHDSDLYLETPNDVSYHGRGFKAQRLVEPGRVATIDNRSSGGGSGLLSFAESDEESLVFEPADADHGIKLCQSAAQAFMDEFESDDELELPGREKASPLDPSTLAHDSLGVDSADERGSGEEQLVGSAYHLDAFESESDQDTGDGAEIGSGPSVSVPKVSTKQWVLECASRLCEGAQHRGVNLQKWFANYDQEGRSSLPQKDFETAFSALLLGLCAGSSSVFVQDVERILEPDTLNELCRALRDPSDSSRIYYMNMVSDAETAQQQARQPSRPSGAHQVAAAPALTVIDSAVSDFLRTALQHDRDGLFERLRIAIHEWKHSQAGRTPTQRLGTSDFISILNIRYAIRAALNADASLVQLGDFASMLESSVESSEEQRARAREQASQSRIGRRNHNGSASLGGPYSDFATGSQRSPSRKPSTHVREKLPDPSDRHRLVTVAALNRWLGANRVSKNIPREAWLSSKAGRAKRASMLQRSQLKAALNGDREAAIALALPSNRRMLDKALASEEGLISEEVLQGEAEGRAHDLLESASGVSMVRKRAVRIANSQEVQDEPLPQSKIAELARKRVLAELVAQEDDALRNTLGPKRDLFLEFARGQQLGSIFGSFYDWMEAREGERKKKRSALRSWKRQKAAKKRNDREGDYVYYAAQLFDKLRSLVAQSCSEMRDPRSGLLICRSTRYSGLDVESLISAIIKRRLNMLQRNGAALSVEESHSRAAKLSAGVFMISQRECCDHFGGLLTTLLADPRTRLEAREMLDPRGTAQHELRTLLETKAGQSRLQAIGRHQHGLHDEDEQVLDALRAELEEKALGRAGFTRVKSEKEAEELLESAEQARQRKSEQEFRRWAKEKAKRMREQRRAVRLQKMEQEKKELERKAKSQKEYQRWKKAAQRNEYLSRKAPSSEEQPKTKRVLKKRAAVVAEPTEVERVLRRPAWE